MAFYNKRIFKIISAIVVLFIVFFIMLVYLGFLDWKKTLITRISSESTRFIGQEVAIEDLSLSLFKGLTLENISIKNPKGFDSGNLLHIKKLYLKTKYRDLIKGTFHFDKISVSSPELTLMKDKNGNVNISEKIRHFFKREPRIKYYIKEFKIDSGVFDFNNDKRYRNDNINLLITNLSSHPGTKTLIKGSVSFTERKISLDGWVYLKDEPKTFAISISSEDFNPSAFKKIFERYKLNIEKVKINFNVHAEGDTEQQIQFTSQFNIAGARSDFLNREIEDIQIDTDSVFNIHEDSVRIKSLSLRADDVAKAQLNVMIDDIRKNPSYDAALKINEIDLSAFTVVPNLTTSGILTSHIVSIKGMFPKNEISISGDVRCVDFAIKSDTDDIKIKHATRVSSSDTGETMHDESDKNLINVEKFPYNITAGDIKSSFKGTISAAGYHGNGVVDAKDISVSKPESKKNILKDAFLNTHFIFKGYNVAFRADAGTGTLRMNITGRAERFQEKDRYINVQADLPEVKVRDIRNSFWNIFPDSLLYAGLDGYVSSHVSVDNRNAEFKATGDIKFKDFILEGENGEYYVGPINGTIPVIYSKNSDNKTTTQLTPFKRSNLEELNTYFSQEIDEDHYRKITIGSLSYGFKLFDNVQVWIDQDGDVLNIRRINGNIFGGNLYGSAIVTISKGLHYKAGFLLKGLSLTELCEGIEPIRGYISGMVNGVGQIKGSGGGLSQLIGKADFWTYGTEHEKTKISKEFIKKIGKTSLKKYLGDRSFDKGIMSLYLKDGFIIFEDLEISNRNIIGIKDLSIKVMPFNNKIAIDHLLWTIVEAAHRAKEE